MGLNKRQTKKDHWSVKTHTKWNYVWDKILRTIVKKFAKKIVEKLHKQQMQFFPQ